MRQFPHVKRNHRSGNWTYFRRFPVSVQAFTGRTFFERSLKTTDRKKIFDPWTAAHSEFEAIVVQAEAPATSGGPTEHPPGSQIGPLATVSRWDGNLDTTRQILDLRIELVQEAVRGWGERQRYDRAQRLLNDPAYREDEAQFNTECAAVGACGKERDWLVHSPLLLALTTGILKEAGISVPSWHGALYAVERMVETEFRTVLEAEARWRQFEYSDIPALPPRLNANAERAPNGEPFLLLDEIITRYVEVTRKPIKTASKLRLVCRYIYDLAGAPIAVNKISKDLLIELQTIALKIPSRQSRAEKSTNIRELAAVSLESKNGRPLLTPHAVKSWFNLLGGCFNWAIAADLLVRNPTQGVKPRTGPRDGQPREPFSTHDLKLLFDPNIYPTMSEPAKFWIPLISLYTGARLNEIGQLLRRDIEFSPVPCIHITDHNSEPGAPKKIKNISSRRKVPIHRDLINLGFLEFAQKDGSPHLFSELPHLGTYEPTKSYSQWFGRYLRKAGVQGRTKVFHSFRHTFKDACRRAGIEEEVHDALTGHANSKNVGRAYGAGVPLPVLAKSVEKIEYGLNFFTRDRRMCPQPRAELEHR